MAAVQTAACVVAGALGWAFDTAESAQGIVAGGFTVVIAGLAAALVLKGFDRLAGKDAFVALFSVIVAEGLRVVVAILLLFVLLRWPGSPFAAGPLVLGFVASLVSSALALLVKN